jgi:hypothetical protein
MKKSILLLFLSITLSSTSQSQTNLLEKEVKSALEAYLHAGDINDAEALKPLLNEYFRVALFDSEKDKTSILEKETYLKFIKEKKFGGYPRTIEYGSILFTEKNMATVQVTLTSPGKPTLKNFYTFAKENNKWNVVQDFVILIK